MLLIVMDSSCVSIVMRKKEKKRMESFLVGRRANEYSI
jgi:hypothetical protein